MFHSLVHSSGICQSVPYMCYRLYRTHRNLCMYASLQAHVQYNVCSCAQFCSAQHAHWLPSLSFDVLLTVHLSIFISVFNQLDALNLFHSKFYFMPLHVSSTCAYHQEVKIVLHGLWYHHTYRWLSRARFERA